jgi:hypothetical protein
MGRLKKEKSLAACWLCFLRFWASGLPYRSSQFAHIHGKVTDSLIEARTYM